MKGKEMGGREGGEKGTCPLLSVLRMVLLRNLSGVGFFL